MLCSHAKRNMEVSSIVLISLIVFVIACIHKVLTINHDVFKNRGVEYEKPKLIFGNMFAVFIGKLKEDELLKTIYEKFSREK